jgi:zinc and cadmium transporter
MDRWVLLGLYCLAILLASALGGLLPLLLHLSHRRLQFYLSFASGAMLGAALCHMLPEAFQLVPGTCAQWLLAGLLGIFFLERFFTFHHHEALPQQNAEHGQATAHPPHAAHFDTAHDAALHGPSQLAWGAATIGLCVHTFSGGVALASTVAAEGTQPGVASFAVFLATVLHKPADSLTITSLMVSGGTSRRRAHLVNLLFALVIPVGVLAFFAGERFVGPAVAGRFAGSALAFSAGTFLSIALGDLMPELQFHRHDRAKLSAALLAGVALMYAAAGLGG